MKTNLGILGGTFDPVHSGHIELAHHAMEFCDLVGVIFIPAFHPPHKLNEDITPFHHRVEMLKLALADDTRLSISEIEQHLVPPTYTVDTLEAFLESSKKDVSYYFIIGIDAFLEITSWKNYEEVLSSTHFIVAARKGYQLGSLRELLESLNYKREQNCWKMNSSTFCIYYLDIDIRDVSSSEIRRKITDKKMQGGLLFDEVQQYIKKNNLYKYKKNR